MNATFKQYKPADLYINMDQPETLEADSSIEVPTTGFCPTGSAFLDAFVNNLHQRGLHSGHFHAKLLGIQRSDMCTTVFTLTGMKYTDFTEAYVLLMANDLLKQKKRDHKQIGKRLGFRSYSGFYRFMMRNGMGKPSWR
jgi:hypothetical protein